jgi:hypothetical protein
MINVVLLCMGRQPLFRPGGINHEIGKLPQQIVDRIPLVMYIPTPPPKDANPKDLAKDSVHTYPPPPSDSPVEPTIAKEPASPLVENLPPAQKRHRFFFLRRSKNEQKPDLEGGAGEDAGDRAAKLRGKMRRGTIEDEWEANWERGEYPFVKLPENRATCAICLLDFEAPPKRGAASSANAAATASGAVSTSTANGDGGTTTVPVEPLSLQDAGEGATPLRLLACGHAFHQTCLDPWLKDVSGRCPVCQKKVDIEELEKLSKKGKSTSWATNVVAPPAELPSPAANVSAGQSPNQ